MQPVGVRYMDPPDGGDVTLAEQVARLVAEVERMRPVVEAVEHNHGPANIEMAIYAYHAAKEKP